MTVVACIGSRETPDFVLDWMEELGKLIAFSGLSVASGNCQGADQAFARGANYVNPEQVMLFLPWPSYEINTIVQGNLVCDWEQAENLEELQTLAANHHPSWKYLKASVKKLMTRNAAIIEAAYTGTGLVLGYLNPDKKGGGGTGHGWRIAETLQMNRINLVDEAAFENAKNEIVMRSHVHK